MKLSVKNSITKALECLLKNYPVETWVISNISMSILISHKVYWTYQVKIKKL